MLLLIARNGHEDQRISAEPDETLAQLFDRVGAQTRLDKLDFELIPDNRDHASGDGAAPSLSLRGASNPLAELGTLATLGVTDGATFVLQSLNACAPPAVPPPAPAPAPAPAPTPVPVPVPVPADWSSPVQYRSLGGMRAPDIGEHNRHVGRRADWGTPDYFLLSPGLSVTIAPSTAGERAKMVHCHLGQHNLLQVLFNLKDPQSAKPVPLERAQSLIFHRCVYRLDGMQCEPKHKEVLRNGSVNGSDYDEFDLRSAPEEHVKWVYCTVTCTAH